ncbi:MAG: hypothetical protein ACU85V_19835 [Gammaproteobacteria bacterium]
MAKVQHGAVPVPEPREAWVEVEALGGEVLVRGLMLSDSFRISRAAQGNNGMLIALTLAESVWCEKDGGVVPLMTVEQWERWGGENLQAAVDLFNRCHEVAGRDIEDAAKK